MPMFKNGSGGNIITASHRVQGTVIECDPPALVGRIYGVHRAL